MFRLDLDGRWTLAWCEPGVGEVRGWPEAGPAGVRLVEATVPGDVHVDLIEAGLIDEPLYGQNTPDCRWVEERDWWYARSFDLPADAIGGRVELHFGGLDCTADVWLNGAHLGRTNNANIPHTLDATAAVRSGLNRRIAVAAATSVVIVCVALFAFFWPVLAASPLTYEQWQTRIWFDNWV